MEERKEKSAECGGGRITKVLTAQHGGFCYGVKRAVECVERALSEGKTPLYTLGDIIHNRTVVDDFRSRGVQSIDRLEEAEEGATVIVRAHGCVPTIFDEAKARNITLIDATCPDVRKVQQMAKDGVAEGRVVYIAGKPAHPEVVGIAGWSGNAAVVLPSVEAAMALPFVERAVVLSQTTLSPELFEAIVDALKKKCGDLSICNTICKTTQRRQEEARQLAAQSDTVIVIGGKNSSNTKELAEISQRNCNNVWMIENTDEISLDNPSLCGIISIIAGASTPSWMMMEVFTRMNELEKKAGLSTGGQIIETHGTVEPEKSAMTDEERDFLEAFEKTLMPIRGGQVMTGTVVQVTDSEVSVNIGYKSDGFIPRSEFTSDDGSDDIKVGDEIEVEVIKVNDSEGNVLLSHKSVEARKAWDAFVDKAEVEGAIFDGVGKEVVKGGLIAYIEGVRTFIPASQVSNRYVENLGDYVNKPLRLKILEVDRNKRRVVASQKQVLQEEAAEKKKEIWGTLEVGQKREGVVRRLTDFGAFVDIGGIDGLVHVTEMAWGRVKHPKDIFSEGQEIEVIIKALDEERERISLGYKELQPDPWDEATEKFPVGSVVEGKVVRIKPFGAFVSLAPRIDGLVHISQVATHRIDKVEDEMKVGQTVRAKVLSVDTDAKRISLSTREVLLDEEGSLEEMASDGADDLSDGLELADEPGASVEESITVSDNGDVVAEEAAAVDINE